MIEYVEKGYGLHLAIARAGHWLRCDNDVWVASDEQAVQALIDGYTLNHAKAAKAADVRTYAKNLNARLAAPFGAAELAMWPVKRAEAAAYAVSADAACPALEAEAAQRGIALAELVDKVRLKAAAFDAAALAIAAADGRHRDAIDALNSFEQVAAYDFTTGWPEV